MNNRIIFMHLPKCGGSTMSTILNRFYQKENTFNVKVIENVRLNIDDFTGLNQSQRDELNLLTGHIHFGIHKYFTNSYDYITFLRDPVERIVSFYYYVKRTPEHRLYQNKLFSKETSLYDFVINSTEGDIHNGQIRFISGIVDSPNIMLERALENIYSNFSFVGIVEKFDESLILLQNMYGWNTPTYKILNETKHRPKIEMLDTQTLEVIRDMNKGDIELYNLMKAELSNKIKATDSFNFDLMKLKFLNRKNYYKSFVKSKLSKLANV
ncbi:sulfotransferase family 2 domain-containing protein [Robertkochia solimangrovi]|uniref:sulfotransferase family 2 domain-containing protein n=1 Tax=Robertkochia solimangrovi TaxID=2213046 RepID=UPI0013A56CA4|nr:sulfotransferase family 2 domain-containing protein [Robertkochia solimangrovi]